MRALGRQTSECYCSACCVSVASSQGVPNVCASCRRVLGCAISWDAAFAGVHLGVSCWRMLEFIRGQVL